MPRYTTGVVSGKEKNDVRPCNPLYYSGVVGALR